MSDGRLPGPLGTTAFARPTGIAPTAAFALPPPLGFGAPPARARLPGGIAPLGVPREVPGGRPVPVPQPRPAPTPMVGKASVFLGPVGRRDQIILDYYTKCGLETVGPGQVAVDVPGRYSTLEGLVDSLLSSPSAQHVIVNHGDPDSGLLVPVCKETRFNRTGTVMGDLSGLADMAEKGPIDPNNAATKVLLQGASQDMGVKPAVLLRIVAKLVILRKKGVVLHFRACNMDDAVMVGAYKSAFGAKLISFHACRLLFMPFVLDQMKPGIRVADLPDDRNSPTERMRKFSDPLGLLAPMVLAIHDIDGHSRVEQESFIEQRTFDQVQGWAILLLRQWQDAAPRDFVVPVMWENKETTFHCPLEPGWRQKLQFV